MTEQRHFEDYKHSESTVLIERLRRMVDYLNPREREFVGRTILKKCILDYELQTKLSPKQRDWVMDILKKTGGYYYG